ncbi:MAG TPA: Ltp family lipoprotein [Actinotalea sp.]|nr:Ltp family lipoprotein [Actinotalea sp.]
MVLLIVVAALNGGNDDGDRTLVADGAASASEQADEKTAEQIAAEDEAQRLADEEAAAEAAAEASAKAEEERVAEEARLAEEAAAAEAAAAEAARIGTLSQQNAYGQAQNYLDFMPFSRAGLIDQLTSEYGGQFPPGDAEFAVARLEAEGGVDWNAEAVEAAQSYQELMPMSRQGLIDQLTSEFGSQFTLEQATYAVDTLGL